ncbi:hemicentin-2-like [Pecten maximus]|uniref:hemicentin-2-like n=1 Tax=Pecten maximus TaxID=6579 RepID=UPI00145839A1|nr:hemicentin-2-like [Pecten maximus]
MRTNAGQYTCTARNTVSQGTKTWNLIVRFPPRILSLDNTDGDSDVAEHGPKSLVCSVDSFPPSTIQWFYKANNTVLLTTPDVLESTYTLTNADCLDTGLYTCSVRNSVSKTAVTRDIHINVLCKPRQDPRVKLNNDFGLATTETLVMNAMFLSNPQPTFSWSFETSPGTGVTKLVNGRDNFDIQDMFTVKNLSVVSVGTRQNIQASWFGVYNVTATNSQGSDTLSFTAAAKGKPDPPYGGLAMCPFEDRATLSWTSGFNGGSSQTFIVGLRTDTQNSITIDRNINQSDPGRGQSVTTTVTGLTADTKHFFTVYAVNEFGNSSLLEEVNCTTQARPSLAESANVAAVVLPVTGVLILLLTAGVVILVRRNRQLCCRNCQLPKQTELQNVQLSERDGQPDRNNERSPYQQLDPNGIAKPSVYSELEGIQHIYQNDTVGDGEGGQYQSLEERSDPNVYDELHSSASGDKGTYVNTAIGGNRKY